MTSQNVSSRYDRHVVGITSHDVWSQKAKIYGVIHIKLNQLVYERTVLFIATASAICSLGHGQRAPLLQCL